MASTIAFLGGLILLCLFLALIGGMALCAVADREFMGPDDEVHPIKTLRPAASSAFAAVPCRRDAAFFYAVSNGQRDLCMWMVGSLFTACRLVTRTPMGTPRNANRAGPKAHRRPRWSAMTAPTYQLATIKDVFDKVPADRIRTCLVELAQAMERAKACAELFGASVQWPDVAEWVDDEKGEIDLQFHAEGELIATLKTRAEGDE